MQEFTPTHGSILVASPGGHIGNGNVGDADDVVHDGGPGAHIRIPT
jgi:hypothetical protein